MKDETEKQWLRIVIKIKCLHYAHSVKLNTVKSSVELHNLDLFKFIKYERVKFHYITLTSKTQF